MLIVEYAVHMYVPICIYITCALLYVCVYAKTQTSTTNCCAYVSVFFTFFFHFVLLSSSSVLSGYLCYIWLSRCNNSICILNFRPNIRGT